MLNSFARVWLALFRLLGLRWEIKRILIKKIRDWKDGEEPEGGWCGVVCGLISRVKINAIETD